MTGESVNDSNPYSPTLASASESEVAQFSPNITRNAIAVLAWIALATAAGEFSSGFYKLLGPTPPEEEPLFNPEFFGGPEDTEDGAIKMLRQERQARGVAAIGAAILLLVWKVFAWRQRAKLASNNLSAQRFRRLFHSLSYIGLGLLCAVSLISGVYGGVIANKLYVLLFFFGFSGLMTALTLAWDLRVRLAEAIPAYICIAVGGVWSALALILVPLSFFAAIVLSLFS